MKQLLCGCENLELYTGLWDERLWLYIQQAVCDISAFYNAYQVASTKSGRSEIHFLEEFFRWKILEHMERIYFEPCSPTGRFLNGYATGDAPNIF